jgi:KDO2-lipid IV(A) lauroyltransferase
MKVMGYKTKILLILKLGEVAARYVDRAAKHRLSPRRNALAGRLLVQALAPFLTRERKHFYNNLDVAFPGGAPFQKESFFRRVLANFVRALLDTVYASQAWPERAAILFDKGELDEALHKVDEAYKRHGRLIVISGHIGSWELLGAVLGLKFDTRAVASKLHYEPYQDAVMAIRKRLGYGIFFQEDPITSMARFVKDGGLLGLIADQDIAHNAGVFVPFFGKDAYTPVGPAALAALTRTTMLPVFCVHEGPRYKVVIGEPIEPPEKRNDDTILALTASWQAEIEKVVRLYPDQWAWFHRRWKTQADDLAKPAEGTG